MGSMTQRTHSKRRPVITRVRVWVWVWAWAWVWVGTGVGGQFPQAAEENRYIFNADGTYSFSYDTGSGRHQSFRSESRDSLGRVTGRFGYLDPDGALRVTRYSADSQGYRATMEVYQRVSVAPTDPLLIGPIPQQPPAPTMAPSRDRLSGGPPGPVPFIPPEGPVLLIGPLPKPLQPSTSEPPDLSQELEEETSLPSSVPPPPPPHDLLRFPPDLDFPQLDENTSLLDRLGSSLSMQEESQLTLSSPQEGGQFLETLEQVQPQTDTVLSSPQEGGQFLETLEQVQPQTDTVLSSPQEREQPQDIADRFPSQTGIMQSSQTDIRVPENTQTADETKQRRLPNSRTRQIKSSQSKMPLSNQADNPLVRPSLRPLVKRIPISRAEMRTRRPNFMQQQSSQMKPDCPCDSPNHSTDTNMHSKATTTTAPAPSSSADIPPPPSPQSPTPLFRRQFGVEGRTRGWKENEGAPSKASTQQSFVPSRTYLPVGRQAPYMPYTTTHLPVHLRLPA